MSIKISELPAATSVGDNDILPIVQNGTTKKATAEKMKTSITNEIDSSSTNNSAAGAKAVFDFAAPIEHSSENNTYGVGTSTNYGHTKTIDTLDKATYIAGEALSAHQGYELDQKKENVSNKTNVINSSSTSDQYPNAAIVFEEINSINTSITNLGNHVTETEEQLNSDIILNRSQIPTYTSTPATSINVKDSSNLPIKSFELGGNSYQATTSIAGGDEYDSPSPDHPQPISVVTGDNTLYFIGKNIFNEALLSQQENYNTYDNNTGLWTTNSGSNYSRSILYNITGANHNVDTSKVIKVNPNTTYTLKFYNVVNTSNLTIKILYADSAGTNLSTLASQPLPTITFTTPNNCEYIDIARQEKSANSFSFSKIQIEVGSTATTYEPYTAQTQLISLGDIELAKTGKYAARIYKDNGKWYLYKAIDKVKSEDISFSVLSSENQTFVSTSSKIAGKYASKAFICDAFYYDSTHQIGSNNSANTNLALNEMALRWTTNDRVYVKTSLTENQLNALTFNIYFILSTPTTTEITDTTLIQQLENVLAMNTYKNETNAFSIVASGNAEANLQIEYYQDIATLFNNVTNAILSLGNNV